jgi:hypothetical protein
MPAAADDSRDPREVCVHPHPSRGIKIEALSRLACDGLRNSAPLSRCLYTVGLALPLPNS